MGYPFSLLLGNIHGLKTKVYDYGVVNNIQLGVIAGNFTWPAVSFNHTGGSPHMMTLIGHHNHGVLGIISLHVIRGHIYSCYHASIKSINIAT